MPSTVPPVAAVARVARGVILAYRVYDAGDTIALDVAEKVLPHAKRLELKGTLVEGLIISVRPLEIELDDCDDVDPRRGRCGVSESLT